MFEKIRKYALRQRYYFYHKLGDISYGIVRKQKPDYDGVWMDISMKLIRKEFEMFRKLKGRDTCY